MGQKKRPGKLQGGLARPEPSKSLGDAKSSSDPATDNTATAVDALVKSECDKALIALRRGNTPKAVKIMREAMQKSSHVALGHRVNGHIHLKLANMIEDPAAKQRHFRTALESARQASILSPRSVEHAHFYAQLLYEYASDGKGYDEVVKECERALAVEEPIDPRESLQDEERQDLATPEARINNMQAELRNMVQKANLASLSTWMKAIGSGSDDKLRFLQVRRLTDDPMEQRVAQPKKPHEVRRSVKTQEERRQEVEVRVAAARLLQQRQQEGATGETLAQGEAVGDAGGKKKTAAEKKKRESDRRRPARISPAEEKLERLKPFWRLMGPERRQELLAVPIEDLRASLIGGGRGSDTSDALSEALQFAQDKKTWRFWACCKCSERFIDSGEHVQHVLSTHIGELTSRQQKMLPSDVDPDWLELLMEDDVRPIDAKAALKILIESAQTVPAAGEAVPDEESRKRASHGSSSSCGGSSSCCSSCSSSSSSEGSADGMSSRGSSESLEKLGDTAGEAPPDGSRASAAGGSPPADDEEASRARGSFAAGREAHKPGCSGDCQRRSAAARAGAELPHSSLPTCDDDERRKLLNRIHHSLRQFLRVKSLCMEQVVKIVQFTMDEVQGMLPESPLHYEFNASPLYMRFLEAHQLKSILKYLMDLATSFDLDRLLRQESAGAGAGAGPASSQPQAGAAEEDIIQDRLLLNEEFTQLLLDERVLKEVSLEPPTFEELEERLNVELRSLNEKEGKEEKEGAKAAEGGLCCERTAGRGGEWKGDGPWQGEEGGEPEEADAMTPVESAGEQGFKQQEGQRGGNPSQDHQSVPCSFTQDGVDEGPQGAGTGTGHEQRHEQRVGGGRSKRAVGRGKDKGGEKDRKKKREMRAKRKGVEVKEVALKADEMTPEKRALLEKQLADEASLRRPLPLMKPKGGTTTPVHEDLQLAWLLGRMDYELPPEKWRQQREEMARKGRDLCDTLKKEFSAVQALCDKKRELCSLDDMLGHVEKLLEGEKGVRERCPYLPPKAFDDILKDRARHLLDARASLSHGRKVELNVLQTVLRESEKVKVQRSSMYTETLQLVARGTGESEEEDVSGRVQEALQHRDMSISHTIPVLREQWTIEQNQLDAKLMKALDSLAKVEAALNLNSVLDYRTPVLPLVKAFILNRIEAKAEHDALLKSNAAQEAFLAELAQDEQQRVPETVAKGIKERPREKRKGRDKPRSKASASKVSSGADEAINLLKDDDCCEEKSDEEPWDEEEEEAARQRLELEVEALRQAEIEAEEQKLEQALEKQRLIEEQAKLQRLAELRVQPGAAGGCGAHADLADCPNGNGSVENFTSSITAGAGGTRGDRIARPEESMVSDQSGLEGSASASVADLALASMGNLQLGSSSGGVSSGGTEPPYAHDSRSNGAIYSDSTSMYAELAAGLDSAVAATRTAVGESEGDWLAQTEQAGAQGPQNVTRGPGSHSAKVHPTPLPGQKPLPPSPDQRPGFQKILRGQVPAHAPFNGEGVAPIKVTPPANHRPQYAQLVPALSTHSTAMQQQPRRQQQQQRAQAANGSGHLSSFNQEQLMQAPPDEPQDAEVGSPQPDGGGREDGTLGRARLGHSRRRRSVRPSRQAHLQGQGEGGETDLDSEHELASWEAQHPQLAPGVQPQVGAVPLQQLQAGGVYAAFPQMGRAFPGQVHCGVVFPSNGPPPGLWYAAQSPASHMFYAPQGPPQNGHVGQQPADEAPGQGAHAFELQMRTAPFVPTDQSSVEPATQPRLWGEGPANGKEGSLPLVQDAADLADGVQQGGRPMPMPMAESPASPAPIAHAPQLGSDLAAADKGGPHTAVLPPQAANGGKATWANGSSSAHAERQQQDLSPRVALMTNGLASGEPVASNRPALVPSGHKLSPFAPSWASLAASPKTTSVAAEAQQAAAAPVVVQPLPRQQGDAAPGEDETVEAPRLDTADAAEERFQADLEAAISQSLDEVKQMGVVGNGLTREHASLTDRSGKLPAASAAPAGKGAATTNGLGEERIGGPEAAAGVLDEAGQGLQNEVGQYNCFVNVVIQSLWHLQRFRDRMLDQASAAHVHQGDPCVVCALREIFCALNKCLVNPSREAVAPTPLRLALSAMYKQTDCFQESQMNDASETLLVIFDCIHCAFAPSLKLADNESRSDNSSSAESGGEWDCDAACAAHALFGLDVKEQMHCCSCGLESRHLKYTSFFHNINATALRMAKVANEDSHLDELLKTVEENHQLPCDPDIGGCSTLNSTTHLLRAAPAVFTLVMGWQNGRESIADISQTVDCIETELNVADVYSGLPGPHFVRLVSVVCYYGQHYHCFAYKVELGRWIMFDDSTVKVVGAWEEVASTCRRGHLQPQVLFYEAPS